MYIKTKSLKYLGLRHNSASSQVKWLESIIQARQAHSLIGNLTATVCSAPFNECLVFSFPSYYLYNPVTQGGVSV